MKLLKITTHRSKTNILIPKSWNECDVVAFIKKNDTIQERLYTENLKDCLEDLSETKFDEYGTYQFSTFCRGIEVEIISEVSEPTFL